MESDIWGPDMEAEREYILSKTLRRDIRKCSLGVFESQAAGLLRSLLGSAVRSIYFTAM